MYLQGMDWTFFKQIEILVCFIKFKKDYCMMVVLHSLLGIMYLNKQCFGHSTNT